MATKAQIRDRAAGDLGVLRLNQPLQSQDATRIETAYVEVYAKLKNKSLATWAFSNDVPDDITPYVVALVASNCVNNYGVSDKRYQRIERAALNAEKRIERIIENEFVSTSEAENF